MALFSRKRRHDQNLDAPCKKSRLDPVEDELPSQDPEHSDNSSVSGIVDDDEIESGLPTPQTTLSSAGSPAYPSNLKTIACNYPGCEKTFNRPAKLAQHSRSHTNTRPFVCSHDGCTKDFLRSSHLQHHIKSAHTDTRDYICDHEGCGKGFVTRTRLSKHRATHEEKQKFACTVSGCGQTFRKHNTLESHVVSVHEGRRPFVCQIVNEDGEACGAGFDRAANLKTHEGSVHSGRTWSCTLCDSQTDPNSNASAYQDGQRIFSSNDALKAHVRDEHSPICKDCGLKFDKPSELATHFEIHHGVLSLEERRKYPCLEPGCGRSFTQKSNLVTHTRTFHLESKAFVCGNVDPRTLTRVEGWDGADACGRVLSSKGNLITHIRTVHLGLEPSRKTAGWQKVAVAESSSIEEGSSHMGSSSGTGYGSTRSFECQVHNCGSKFQQAYDLQRHMDSFHGAGAFGTQTAQVDSGRSVIRQCFDGSHYVASATEFDNGYGFEDYLDGLEDSAAIGGTFWLGGEDTLDVGSSGLFDWGPTAHHDS